MSGLNIKLADLQISDFHAPECCFFVMTYWKKPSASGGVALRPLPGALPLDPTGGLLRPPDPHIIFLLFQFSPVPCVKLALTAEKGFFLICPFVSTKSTHWLLVLNGGWDVMNWAYHPELPGEGWSIPTECQEKVVMNASLAGQSYGRILVYASMLISVWWFNRQQQKTSMKWSAAWKKLPSSWRQRRIPSRHAPSPSLRLSCATPTCLKEVRSWLTWRLPPWWCCQTCTLRLATVLWWLLSGSHLLHSPSEFAAVQFVKVSGRRH